MAPAKDIDEFIAAMPEDHRAALQRVRELIAAAAPKAEESISYGVPTFKYLGKPLVYFGDAKNHYALYGVSGVIREKYREELAGYSMSKGTIRFPHGEPIPAALIRKMVKDRVAENEAGAEKKKKR